MKLIKKTEGWYNLYDGEIGIGSTHKELQGFKLSLKNCEAIELGYDLDEEVSNIVKTIVPDDRGTDIWYGTSMSVGKLCFQKALELMGDKKFSEEDLRTAYGVGYLMKINPSDEYHETLNGLVQLLQQTEWDVEIIEFTADDLKSINNEWHMLGEPKLDADGCLILKRI